MRTEVIARMRCPVCRSRLHSEAFESVPDGAIKQGIVLCCDCGRWYPIDDFLLELLPDELAYVDDRKAFWSFHSTRLEALGLSWRELTKGRDLQPQLKQQSHFDWYATNDEQTYSSYEQMPFWRAVDDKIFSEWCGEMDPGRWVLDVGCAQGRSAFKLIEMPIKIVGFDISKALVRQAIAAYRAAPHVATATFFVGDGSTLPFLDESFDYVLIYGVLHHLPEPSQTCAEVVRVLKHGGVYFGSENNQTGFRKIFDLLMKIAPLWHEEAGAQPLIGEEKFRSWLDQQRMKVEISTRVFVPPHLVNLLGQYLGVSLFELTDRIGRRLPLLRENGGLIVLKATKR